MLVHFWAWRNGHKKLKSIQKLALTKQWFKKKRNLYWTDGIFCDLYPLHWRLIKWNKPEFIQCITSSLIYRATVITSYFLSKDGSIAIKQIYQIMSIYIWVNNVKTSYQWNDVYLYKGLENVILPYNMKSLWNLE